MDFIIVQCHPICTLEMRNIYTTHNNPVLLLYFHYEQQWKNRHTHIYGHICRDMGSQQDKVKFQDQLFTKFLDILRPQAAKYTVSVNDIQVVITCSCQTQTVTMIA